MGTSKVIKGLGVYVVIGLYPLAFNVANQAIVNNGTKWTLQRVYQQLGAAEYGRLS